MTDYVQFPDLATVARSAALQGLPDFGVTGIDIGTETPSPMPEQFIKLVPLPGGEICRRTMWGQVIGEVYDLVDDMRCSQLAHQLAMVWRAAPDRLIDGQQPVTEPCEINGPFPSKDPDMPDAYRYQVTVTWTVQSTVLTV
ncbi:hypothetical protein [Mycolicibacterium mucogenicum]|uniref:Tail terminator n=1 Tax=Mycolicibacterium mucogenicum DSM 44124 TaxID=1226753 RepID=A0A8E4R719_MYCMU|nr:hypothetical protein [Mycolicibacterium mucogenicum]KAB7755201.1 hypothetical protein MMUC44124_20675 [Mycolicibacterium mucogenicum DSM 44124]QPG68883.1 hypothetical protein C1S78_026280 [Mycolicibacterium mucogenicum DSM 44124]